MKIAIVGGSLTSKDLAPFDDTEYEIWVHGNQFDQHENRRVSKIFEIHDDLSDHDEIYPSWLASKNIHLIVGEKFPIKKKHIEVYPYKKAIAIMGEHLTSTPAYMMAYAILHGATHISIYGVDMGIDDHEYFYQRPTMYAWIGYARAKGIEVYIPPESPLFVDKHIEGRSCGKPDYGLPPFTSSQFLEMADMHHKKMNEYQTEINRFTVKIHTHGGSKQSYERLAKVARAVESGQDLETLTNTKLL